MWLWSESCWFKHYISTLFFEVNFYCDTESFIKFKESNWLIRFEWPRILYSLWFPLRISFRCEFMEWFSMLKTLKTISHKDKTSTNWIGTASRGCLRSYCKLVNHHWLTMEVSEVELWTSIVACKYLIIVEDDCVDLVVAIELCTLVSMYNERQVLCSFIFWLWILLLNHVFSLDLTFVALNVKRTKIFEWVLYIFFLGWRRNLCFFDIILWNQARFIFSNLFSFGWLSWFWRSFAAES